MVFSSHIFLFLFLPLTLSGFCLFSRVLGPKPAKNWLTLASLVFYGWWNPIYTVLIVASMLVNFYLGRHIAMEVRGGRSRSGHLWLVAGVTANLLLLGYYKYANFFVNNVNAVFGTDWNLGQIILPLGISFFTFTQIAYLVDARRGLACEYDLGDFLLFITFFPHLIAGPIIHHSEMMPQFREAKTYRFDWNNLAVGLAIFSVGLFKKTVIADRISDTAIKIHDAAAAGMAMSGSDAWAGALAYVFQVYFDFSGYSDMAIGLSRMFGIVLPLNFNSPLKATSLTDFWRRWHMTLGRFLRDYVFIPLGGSRRGEFRRCVNLMLTMLVCGFWHGAAWTFVVFGFIQGVGLLVNHLWSSYWKTRPRPAFLPSWSTEWMARTLTFLTFVVSCVVFRAVDLFATRHLLEAMSGLGAGAAEGAQLMVRPGTWIWMAFLLAFVWILPNTVEIFSRYQPYPEVVKAGAPDEVRWYHWNMGMAKAWLCALMLGIAILALSKSGEFLYYNF